VSHLFIYQCRSSSFGSFFFSFSKEYSQTVTLRLSCSQSVSFIASHFLFLDEWVMLKYLYLQAHIHTSARSENCLSCWWSNLHN